MFILDLKLVVLGKKDLNSPVSSLGKKTVEIAGNKNVCIYIISFWISCFCCLHVVKCVVYREILSLSSCVKVWKFLPLSLDSCMSSGPCALCSWNVRTPEWQINTERSDRMEKTNEKSCLVSSVLNTRIQLCLIKSRQQWKNNGLIWILCLDSPSQQLCHRQNGPSRSTAAHSPVNKKQH